MPAPYPPTAYLRMQQVRKDGTGVTDALRVIAQAPLRVPSPLERYRPAPTHRVVHGDVILTASDDAGLDFNMAIVLGPAPPTHVFALAGFFFAGTDYSVIVESETASLMEAAVRARGWRLDEAEPALVLTPIPVTPPPPPDLAIHRVTTERAFADFVAVTHPPSVFLPSLVAALDPAVALFVGYRDGTPVATSRIARYDDVGEINGVVTVPAERRRGLGTAMTWAAIAAGVDSGCTAITLSASAMGYPVYVRMGFVPVCVYRTYLPPLP